MNLSRKLAPFLSRKAVNSFLPPTSSCGPKVFGGVECSGSTRISYARVRCGWLTNPTAPRKMAPEPRKTRGFFWSRPSALSRPRGRGALWAHRRAAHHPQPRGWAINSPSCWKALPPLVWQGEKESGECRLRNRLARLGVQDMGSQRRAKEA